MLKSIEFAFRLDFIFKFVLFIALVISFYVFINIIVFKDVTYKKIFSTWQFPMLLALFMDVIYGL